MTTPRPKRWFRWLLYGGLTVLLLVAAAALGMAGVPPFSSVAVTLLSGAMPHRLTDGLADIRPESVLEAGADAAAAGRARLERLAERHGLAAAAAHTTLSVTATDEWAGSGPWWPAQNQRFRLDELLGTFTSRAELLDGPGAGQIWGIQAWSPWVRETGAGPIRFLDGDDPRRTAIEFYLPTLHYFNELVFRLRSAPVVLDGGRQTVAGKAYETIYVSWNEGPPREDVDQYVLYIDPESGLLAMAHYTVRDGAGFAPRWQRTLMRAAAAGTIHFRDYRSVGGVQLPFEQIVTLFGPEQAKEPLAETFFHRLLVEEASFDRVAPSELIPDPSRGEPGDRKPDSV